MNATDNIDHLFLAIAQVALFRSLGYGARVTIGDYLAGSLSPDSMFGGWGSLMDTPVYVHQIGWDRESKTGIYEAHSLGGLR